MDDFNLIAVRYLLLTLVFFPSVTFDVISAEIFPWATLFALVSLRHVHKEDALLTSLLILVMLVSAGWSLATQQGSDAIRSLAAYINPILAFVTFINLPKRWQERAIKLGRKIFIFVLCLGVGQYLGVLAPIDGFLSALVPRASATALTSSGGRGVTLLSSEPSRAGVEVVYLFLLWRLTGRRRGLIVEDIALLIFLGLAIKAAQPFAFGVLAVGMLLVRRWYHIVLVAFLIFLAPLVELGSSSSRVLVLINEVRVMGFSDAVYFVANESGHRLLSIYAFFSYGIYHPFGGGIGSWAVSSIEAIRLTGVDISGFRYFMIHGDGDIIGVRGSGLISNLMLDGGIIITGLFLFWVFRLTKRFRAWDRVTWVIMSILILKISFIGSVGEPLPWVVSALVLRDNFFRKAEKKELSREEKAVAS